MPSQIFTPRDQQSAPRTWWDDTFTRLLLESIPAGARSIVELDCGLARAAHSLLPALPDASYLGCDPRPELLAEARAELSGHRLEARVELRLATASGLPAADGSADLVLSLMGLQSQPDLRGVLAEVVRVLRSGGRLLAVEPDNLGQRFYFDGGLEEVSQAFHALALRARVARQPADIALGPRLPGQLQEAGLLRVAMRPHLIGSARLESAQAFFARLQRVAQNLALECGVPADDERVVACEAALKRSLFAGLPRRLGHSCHLVPVFLCLGERP